MSAARSTPSANQIPSGACCERTLFSTCCLPASRASCCGPSSQPTTCSCQPKTAAKR